MYIHTHTHTHTHTYIYIYDVSRKELADFHGEEDDGRKKTHTEKLLRKNIGLYTM